MGTPETRANSKVMTTGLMTATQPYGSATTIKNLPDKRPRQSPSRNWFRPAAPILQ